MIFMINFTFVYYEIRAFFFFSPLFLEFHYGFVDACLFRVLKQLQSLFFLMYAFVSKASVSPFKLASGSFCHDF